jgi:UDP-N-acetyl-2-amino-2-deoxyglucuronate dehydrogenase
VVRHLLEGRPGPWAHANPAGDYAEGRLQFGAVTIDWTLSTRQTDLPAGTRADAARYIAVDGDIICDFSDYSRLHSIVYQEIIAGRGHRIEDASAAVKLAERVCQAAETKLPPGY